MSGGPRILVSFSRTLAEAEPGHPKYPYRVRYLEALQTQGAAVDTTGCDASLEEIVAQPWDGVLLTGGGDVHPRRYGAPVEAAPRHLDERRDELELGLARWALGAGVPLLGVCRGIQVMGVALGAPLIQHLETGLAHEAGNGPGDEYERMARRLHEIRIEGGTRLRSVVGGDRLAVTSSHHQAVASTPPGAVAGAWAPDGVLEALEVPEHPFFLGVQAHPEWMQDDPAGRALFRGFVAAASDRRR